MNVLRGNAWETLGSVGAIGTAPQQKMGGSDGGDAFGDEVAVAQGLPVGSAAAMRSTAK